MHAMMNYDIFADSTPQPPQSRMNKCIKEFLTKTKNLFKASLLKNNYVTE